MNHETARRSRARRLVELPKFQRFIVGLIVLNAAILGLETSEAAMAAAGPALVAVDRAIPRRLRHRDRPARVGLREALLFRPLEPVRLLRRRHRLGTGCGAVRGAPGVTRAARAQDGLRGPAMRRVVMGLLNAIPGIGLMPAGAQVAIRGTGGASKRSPPRGLPGGRAGDGDHCRATRRPAS